MMYVSHEEFMEERSTLEKESNKNSIQWQPLIEMIIVLVTILGSTIPLYIHTDSKILECNREFNTKLDKIAERMDATLQGIREDMRDFHGRLCAIEERSKEKK